MKRKSLQSFKAILAFPEKWFRIRSPNLVLKELNQHFMAPKIRLRLFTHFKTNL